MADATCQGYDGFVMYVVLNTSYSDLEISTRLSSAIESSTSVHAVAKRDSFATMINRMIEERSYHIPVLTLTDAYRMESCQFTDMPRGKRGKAGVVNRLSLCTADLRSEETIMVGRMNAIGFETFSQRLSPDRMVEIAMQDIARHCAKKSKGIDGMAGT